MRNIKLTISYKGTNYYGWQKQPNQNTIQKEIERAAFKVFGSPIDLIGSGRTDAGVHAIAQIANFTTQSKLPLYKIQGGINNYLPLDISITNAEDVAEDFHAQYSAKAKNYEYRCYTSKHRQPLLEGIAEHIYIKIDVGVMKKALKYLIGTYDFKGFTDSRGTAENTVRTIFDLTIEEAGDSLIFKVHGNGFLHKMVRNIVGTLLEIGREARPIESIKEILESRDRKKAGKTASACGLYLVSVEY
ncbi:MAG: tRNA pseudouridine(38-40) synthase TruA [Firmicutes bacterium]|nr:tRNA pseudouridine(38-40) synthase TruA [Bacillota bacterium]